MSDIPHAVLSEHFQQRMSGRRLVSAVFTTFQFEPAFFELEVLPVFLDVPLSHASAIRWVQLEDALRSLRGNIAVYYDAHGLLPGNGESAKLDIRRLPVRHRTGIFHPKNVLLLVEASEPDERGERPRALLVAAMSANLTRAGWWENVEVCHVEEIADGAKSRLRDELLAYLETLEGKVPGEEDHAALNDIRAFLKRTEPRAHRSAGGTLFPHFYRGSESLVDFLSATAGSDLAGMNLEIISPFFDQAPESKPLLALMERFSPQEVRLFLPRNRAGEATLPKELYTAVREMPGVGWGHFPGGFLKMGRSEDAANRHVHAKVYRFFSQRPKREILFIGSVNLTQPGHQRGGNLETGFLIEIAPPRRPDFWLTPEERRQTTFGLAGEAGEVAASGGTRLTLRYWWDSGVAQVFWDAPQPSPALRVESNGCAIFAASELPPRTWLALPVADAERVGDVVRRTSIFTVVGDGPEPGVLLVQEEGMSHKPSLLTDLTAADILRFWSLLTVEQRSAFIEAKGSELARLGDGLELVADVGRVKSRETLFDRFAGFFHAFGCLERSVKAALEEGNEVEAHYRLFGRKYDSLGSFLDRVISNQDAAGDVDRYLLGLCAKQLCSQVEADWPDFWTEYAEQANTLMAIVDTACGVREQLCNKEPDTMPAFLDWFDSWFMRRAEPMETVA